MKLYSIKIKSLKAYKAPFNAPSDQAAVLGVCEAFKEGLINGKVLDINDLSIFLVGSFDDKSGNIQKTKPKLVTDLADVPGIQSFLKGVVDVVSDAVQ